MTRRLVTLTTAVLVISTLAVAGTPPAGAARKTTLRVGIVALATLDPAQAGTPTAAAVAELLFQPLPKIAKWRANTEQTQFTFTLRKHVKFSDGAVLTASDVKATLDRVAAKATKSPLASLLDPVKSVVAQGSRTVVITLGRAQSTLPVALANPGLGIVEAAKVATVATTPIGSGAFRVAANTPTEARLPKARGVSAHVDEVRLSKFATDAAAQSAFAGGRIDLLQLGSGPPIPAVAKRHHREVAVPYLALGYYALDLKNPKFADVRFRTAVLRALDAAQLVKVGYGTRASPTHGVVPRAVLPSPANPCAGLCDHDLVAAKSLLAQAFPHGGVPPIGVDFDDSPVQQALAKEVVAQLAAAGIPAVARPHPAKDYAQFLADGQPDLFRLGWVGFAPSPDAFLVPLFASGAPENVAHVGSPVADAAVKAAEAEGGARRRQVDFANAQRAVLAAEAVAPVVQFATRLAAQPQVGHLHVDVYGGFDGRAVTVHR